MHITIAERLRPFEHIPGTFSVLPGSALRFQMFPALIRVYDLSESLPKFVTDISLNLNGPLKDFTITHDLEKGMICVLGHSQEGYFRYRIVALKESVNSFAFVIEKGHFLSFTSLNDYPLKIVNHCDLQTIAFFSPESNERLSLGNNKAQDWTMVQRRQNLAEIFPHWLRLGQLIPTQKSDILSEGTFALLDKCRKANSENSRLNILMPYLNLYKAGFEGILSPRLEDEQHQGLHLPSLSAQNRASALLLLSEGAKLIRRLFISYEEDVIHILPILPPEFHSGRFIQIRCDDNGILDIEWTKKMVRRVVFYSETTTSLQFKFPKEVQGFRLKQGNKDCGSYHLNGSFIQVEAQKKYYFDKFTK